MMLSSVIALTLPPGAHFAVKQIAPTLCEAQKYATIARRRWAEIIHLMTAILLQPFARDGKRVAPPAAQAPSLDLPMLATLVHRHIEKNIAAQPASFFGIQCSDSGLHGVRRE